MSAPPLPDPEASTPAPTAADLAFAREILTMLTTPHLCSALVPRIGTPAADLLILGATRLYAEVPADVRERDYIPYDHTAQLAARAIAAR